jgi:hypothetical protein
MSSVPQFDIGTHAMNSLPSHLRDLARQLIAAEVRANEAREHAGARVVAALDTVLSRVAGTEGSRSLLSRAKVLASIEVPWLATVELTYDGGYLRAVERPKEVDVQDHEQGSEALMAHILGLLHTFIGEALMLQLVREAWPDNDLGDIRKDPNP